MYVQYPGWKGARDRAITRELSAGYRVNLARFSRAFMPLLAVIAANLASSIARFCKLSPLGANVKLGESGFAIYIQERNPARNKRDLGVRTS